MTVGDFMEMFTEPSCQNIELYGVNSQETIFKGRYEDIDNDRYDYMEIETIDTIYTKSLTIVLNVED